MTKKLEPAKVPQGVLVTAILALAAIEMVALMKGINGIMLTIVVGVIAAAAGIAMPQLRVK